MAAKNSGKNIFKKLTDKAFIRKNLWMLFSVCHFLLTFLFERTELMFDSSLSEVNWTKQVGSGVSLSFEKVLLYTFAKIIAGFIICGIWKLIFAIIDKKIPKHIVVIFGIIYVVSFFCFLVRWPEYSFTSDSCILFSFSIRLLSWYWHSFYTSALFAGLLMVFPHPVIFIILQPLALACALGYVYYRWEKFFNPKKVFKFLFIPVLLLPEFIEIGSSPYRYCFYSILCLYYFGRLCMDLAEHKKCTKSELAQYTGLSVILAVWRSEGIIIGILGMAVVMIFLSGKKLIKIAIYVTAFAMCFVAMNKVQKIGEDKYYGKDYTILTTLVPLHNVLIYYDSNLDYDSAQQDLANIDKIVPVKSLAAYGDVAYRANNAANGFTDFNQSGADEEKASAYIKSAISIILHNPVPYIKGQLNQFLQAFKFDYRFDLGSYSGEAVEYSGFAYDSWRLGEAEIGNHKLVGWWENCSFRILAEKAVNIVFESIENVWEKSHVMSIFHVLVLLLDAAIVLTEFVRLLRKKYESVSFGVLALILCGETLAIVLTMPVAFFPYFYAIMLSSYALIPIYAGVRVKLKSKHK